jgi:hypothetical protein
MAFVAVTLGESHSGQADGHEHSAREGIHPGQDPQTRTAPGRPLRPDSRGGRRLVAALASQASDARDAERRSGQNGRNRPEAGIDGNDKHRAGDEDELISSHTGARVMPHTASVAVAAVKTITCRRSTRLCP